MARPINDNFDKAIVIRGDGFTYSGSTAEATNQYPEGEAPGYDDYVWDPTDTNYVLADDKSVWFTYTAAGVDEVTFSVSASFSTEMTVFYNWEGEAAVNSVGDLTSGTTSVSFETWAGQQFFIRLSGTLDESGDYVFSQTAGPAGLSSALLGTSGPDVIGVLGDGAQEMIGDLGDDLYYVDSSDDVVTELGGEGYDAVYTTVDFALPANVEKIVAVGATGLTLTGNELDNQLFGASGADTLLGGAGDDRLDGRGGIDRLVGGEGDDVYVVSTYKDVVVELADEGYDVVVSKGSFQLTENVEELRLTGQAVKGLGNDGDNKLVGNDQDNLLSGFGGVDRLYGGVGDDTLTGGAGKDVLIGGAGADVFAFTNVGDAGDVVTDFEAGVDRIQIDLAGFDLATFDATSFESNARGVATTEDARFIYAESNGRLFFDADGSGAGRAVLLATLRGAPELTADDVSAFSLV